jgi:hypothetical protein
MGQDLLAVTRVLRTHSRCLVWSLRVAVCCSLLPSSALLTADVCSGLVLTAALRPLLRLLHLLLMPWFNEGFCEVQKKFYDIYSRYKAVTITIMVSMPLAVDFL